METPTSKKASGPAYIHVLITMALMLVIGNIPAIAPLSQYGMRVIGILVGVVYGMSMVDVFWPSVCAILGLGIASGNMAGIIGQALGTDLVWSMIFIFLILYALQTENVSKFFANWIISRKILKGRPWLFSCFILLGISFLSIISPEAGMLLFWQIIYSTCDSVGISRDSKWSQCMLFGSCMAGSTGVIYLPIIRNGLVVSNQFAGITGMTMDSLKYIIAMVPLVIAGLVIYTLLCKLIFRIDVSALKNLDDSIVDKEALKLGGRQKFVIAGVAAMILLRLLPSVLPNTWYVTQLLNNLGLFGMAAIVVLVFCVVKIDGSPIIYAQEAASKGVIWPMVVMVALITPLGIALTSPDAGITELISNILGPIVNNSSPWYSVAVLVVVGVIFTNFAQNLIIMGIMLPLAFAMSSTVDINMYAITILLAIATHYACVLPSASPSAGMMFSNPYFKPTYAYKYGIITLAVCTIFILTAGYLWVNLVF